MIRVCEPTLRGNEQKYVLDCLQSGMISSLGDYVKKFEEAFAQYCEVKYGVACSNGTTAIHLALEALGIGPGDEVIIPTFTMIATSNAVLYAGATPVFVDSEEKTWNMDVNKIEEKITPRTKAILPVHIYGHPTDMDEIHRLAKKHHLLVIEDAAEAHGALYKGQKAGSFSDVACFSFYANKIITCFPPETKILIKPPLGGRGLSRMKKIKELKVGDLVLTYDTKTSEKEYKKITRTFKREYHDLLITLMFSNNNHLRITPNHPVYVINKGWVRADQLNIGDEVIQYNYRGLAYKEMYTGATYEAIMGKLKGIRKREGQAQRISVRHNDPNSGYALIDRLAVAKKIGAANRGKKRSEEVKKNLQEVHKMRWRDMSAEDYAIFRQKMKEVNADPEVRRKKSEAAKRLGLDPAYRKKVSDGVIRAMKRDSYWENYVKSMNLKPNKPEQFVLAFVEKHFPGEFGYNGDYRLKIRIDKLIPDFVHVKGKKKVIDILGSYWHTANEYHQRSERYKQHGYDSLILWEQELKDEKTLKERIKTFIYNPNVKIIKVVRTGTEKYQGEVYNIETEKNNNYFAHGILVHNCGEGGMIVTNNPEIAEKARLLRNHAFTQPRFIHHHLGFNYRMTNIQAAIGLAQLEQIDTFVESRIRNAQLYNTLLSTVPGIRLPPAESWAKNVYWMYGIVLKDDFPLTKDQLMKKLEERGIETRSFFYPLHQQPFLQQERYQHISTAGEYPVADRLWERGLYLPSSSHLTEEEIKTVVEAIKEIREEAVR